MQGRQQTTQPQDKNEIEENSKEDSEGNGLMLCDDPTFPDEEE